MIKPMLILISGGTAAGKSSIAELISNKLLSSITLTTDHFYKTSKAPIDWDNPKSIHSTKLKEKLISLLERKKISYPRIEKVVENGINTEIIFHDNSEIKNPADVIIVEGVHALQFEAINKIADLKIYVHADDDIRLMRKLKRIPKQIKGFLREFDHEERLKFVFHLMDRWSKWARTDHVKYILPTKDSADLVIDNNPENIANNSKLKEIIRLVKSNNKKEFEKFKNRFKKRKKAKKWI